MTRETQKDDFLHRAGHAGAKRQFLAGDASFRKYDRVWAADGTPMVLMDAPPEHEDTKPFIHIAQHLKAQGLAAPTILANDETHGFLLLEDFGDTSFTSLLVKQPELEKGVYHMATDALVALHRAALPMQVMPYSMEKLLEEASLLVDWFLAATRGKKYAATARKEYMQRWESILNQLPQLPPVLCLRDYHADNLMWREEQKGIARVGLLDFQDAVIGSPAYDMVSFLEDARRDVAPETIEHCLSHYIAQRHVDDTAFRTHFAVLGAQRNAKIVGIFTRLTLRDHKPHYLDYLPRVWQWLNRDLEHPALAPIAEWMNQHVPAGLRGAHEEEPLRQRFETEEAA